MRRFNPALLRKILAGVAAISQFFPGFWFTFLVVFITTEGWYWNLGPSIWLLVIWLLLFKPFGLYAATRKSQVWSIVFTVLLGIVEQIYALHLWNNILESWSPLRLLLFPGLFFLLLQSQIGLWYVLRKLWPKLSELWHKMWDRLAHLP